jgi:uncharacterized protein
MYIPRTLTSTLVRAVDSFPVVLLTGPRQSGKTTLLKRHFGAEAAYLSFDDPLNRDFARQDPKGFLAQFASSKRTILDEIQYVPELLPYLKLRIDDEPSTMGRWILTGSQQFHLMRDVSESLAGRVAILELLAFSQHEAPQRSIANAIWLGGYPIPSIFPDRRDLWVRSYLQTYLERDVRQLQNIRDIKTFEQFVGLCAAMHGQDLNMARLARNCGASQPTVKNWLSVLEASYLIACIPPYFNNLGKRLVKSSKLYFLDSALVTTLTRQPGKDAALAGAMGGSLFEGFIVTEAIKAFTNGGRRPNLWHWRSADGLEVDLLVQGAHTMMPIEIKLTQTPTHHHTKPMRRLNKSLKHTASPQGVIVCRIPQRQLLPNDYLALPAYEFSDWLTTFLHS